MPSSEDTTICVATFGGTEWVDLANTRAIPSATATGATVLHHHGDTIHETRTALLEKVTTEFVVFLDADDELEPGYLEHMESSTADIMVPAVRFIWPGADIPQEAEIPQVGGHRHDCGGVCLTNGNWIVIGAVCRTAMAKAVGWREWERYEDWDFWWRLWQAGATVERVPKSVYRAYVRLDSRNNIGTKEDQLRTFGQIVAANQAGNR